jgi:amino acid adenylation domain-containing protein
VTERSEVSAWASLAAEVLAVDQVELAPKSSTSSFVRLGGTSLRAMELIGRGRSLLGETVDIADLLADVPLATALAGARTLTASELALTGGTSPAATYEVSAGQQAMLLSERIGGGAPFHLLISADIHGPVDVARLDEAIAQTVRRHEALRTVFVEAGDILHYRVLAHARPEVLHQSLPTGTGDDPVTAVHAQLAPAATTLLDAYRRPPVLFVVTRVDDHRYVLSLLIHHALVDGWSVGRMWAELFDTYRGTGPDGGGPPVRSLHDLEQSPAVRALAAERIAELAGMLAGVEPAARAAAGGHGTRGTRLTFALDALARRACEDLAERCRVTRNAVLLASWVAVLARYTGAATRLVSVAGAGRGAVPLDLVAMATKEIPVVCTVPPGATVVEHIAGVAGALSAALRVADVPTQWIVDGLRRSPASALAVPRFAFAAHDELIPTRIRAGDLTVTLHEGHCLGAATDATLFVQRWDDTCRLALQYRTEVFRPHEASALAESLNAALRDMAADPDGPITSVRAVTDAQRGWLDRAGWGGAVTGADDLWRLFERMARSRPDQTAVYDGGAKRSLRYRELVSAAEAQSARLTEAGVRPGDRVAVCMHRSAEEVVAVLGILRCGAAYTALDPDAPAHVIAEALAIADPRVVLVSGEPTFTHPGPVLAVTDPWQGAPAAIAVPAPAPVDPERAAYVAFTSGSTGRPKAVSVPHRGVARLINGADYLRADATTRFLRFAPLGFDASTFEMFLTLGRGGALQICRPGPVAIAELGTFIVDRDLTGASMATGLFGLLAEQCIDAFAGLRQVIVGGDVLPPDAARRVLHRYPGLRITNVYGPTENTSITSVYTMDDPADVESPVPVGTPIRGTGVLVLDEEGRLLPPGATGELYTYGLGVGLGYLGDPAATRAAFGRLCPDHDGSLYRTGDLVRWDGRGRLQFLGRRDNQLKVGGFRVEPDGVAQILRECPGVTDAVVVPIDDGVGVRLAAAVVAPAEPGAVDLVRAFALRRLPGHAVPSLWAVLPELPVNANGKTDREAVARQIYDASRFGPAEAVLDSGQLDAASLVDIIARVWAEVLGTDDFGPDDSFLDIGGDSLLLTEVATRMRQVLPERTFTVLDLIRYPTINSFAAYLLSGPPVAESG